MDFLTKHFTVFLLVLVSAVVAEAKTYRSCKEIKQDRCSSRNGFYRISTNIGRLWVYCEMESDGGGYTFMHIFTRNKKKLDLKNIFTDKTKVLLQLQYENSSQSYTVIEPLNSSQVMSIMINSHAGFRAPKNINMGDYLFFGISPIKNPKGRGTQGFISNSKPVTFRNCVSYTLNGFFALFPNIHGRKGSYYHSGNLVYERVGVSVDWRKTAKPAVKKLPKLLFFFTEIHFGGCGTYSSSDRWRDGPTSVAIGIR